MKFSGVQKKAKKIGIKNPNKFTKKELIKTIQRTEGNFDCFGAVVDYCDQFKCSWRKDCFSLK
ncbi:MAG: SAP domain-containing protein [Candidatus Omnitrophica bacterium]|nr:SAP domain-containing protein [Candidatus Omnitrophota bacterium]